MNKENKNLNLWDRMMMAITFAEAGEAETAKDMLKRKQQRPEARVRKEAAKRPEIRV